VRIGAIRALGAFGDLFRGSSARREHRSAREATCARLLAETLGRLKGPYAKLGQFASLRHDVLPDAWRGELTTLRDRVPPLPLAALRSVLETELGQPLDAAFRSFDERPLGAASIGQAHRAELPDGRAVVVKVQYPWLEEALPADLRLLRRAARWWTRGRGAGPQPLRWFDEFASGLREELDFTREAEVAAEIAANLADDTRIVVPEVVPSHSARRVLTVAYHPAVAITDLAALRALRVDPAEVLEILVRAYAKQVFVDGLFHADPHPGNLFVLDAPGAPPRLLFVDFGLSRRLAPALRDESRRAIFALLQGDTEAFLASMKQLDMIEPGSEVAVREAVERMIGRLRADGSPLGLGADRVLSLKDEALDLLRETPGLQLPNDLLLYARTLSYMFSLGREIAPEVDLMKLTVPWLLRFLATREADTAVASRAGRSDAGPGAG
jgi:predicted unusual protein kinase regulating ubiquinone biosynthesis (AarF/ABC1/UbiB family)